MCNYVVFGTTHVVSFLGILSKYKTRNLSSINRRTAMGTKTMPNGCLQVPKTDHEVEINFSQFRASGWGAGGGPVSAERTQQCANWVP